MPGPIQVELSDAPGLNPLPGWRTPRSLGGALGGCSLVVPTYCRPAELLELLDALAALPDPPAEVVIVDGTPGNSIEAPVSDWTRGRRLRFDLLYARSPKGLTRQRNAGIDLASGSYIFFLDDDAIPHPGYFSEMLSAFERHPDAGGLGGAVANQMARPLNRRWRIRLATGLVPRVPPDTWHPSGTSTPRALLQPFSGVRPVDVLPGCAFAFRREALCEFRFSEFFDGYAQGEDLEMSLRVGRKWKLLSCGDARVDHNTAQGGRPGSFAKGRMEVRNRYFIWKRHAGAVRAVDRFRFWADFLFLVAMDLAWFCARPWKPAVLAHGLGVLQGIGGCLFAPPRFEEPAAHRQYQLVECHD